MDLAIRRRLSSATGECCSSNASGKHLNIMMVVTVHHYFEYVTMAEVVL